MQKVELLYKRAQQHENLTVRRFIAKSFMKQSGIHDLFTVTTFVDYLSDPGLYSDSIELIGKSKFGILLSNFFVNFIQTSSQSTNFSKVLILKAFEKVEFSVGFRYFVDIANKIYSDDIITAEILESALSVTNRQMTQLTPYHRHQALLLLKRFVESNSEHLIPKLKLAGKLKINCNIKTNDMVEAENLFKDCINSLTQDKPFILNFEELGILFTNILSNTKAKHLLPLFTCLQSIYKNAYLKADKIKQWLEGFY